MKKHYLLAILVVLSVSLFAQSNEKIKPNRKFINRFYDAEAFIYEVNYDEALDILLKLDAQDPDNGNTLYKIGLCYLKSKLAQDKAEDYLVRASDYISETYKDDSHRERNAPYETLLYLGEAYRFNFKFDESKATFIELQNMLEQQKPKNTELIAQVEWELSVTDNAIYAVNHPVDADVRNLGPNINTEYREHSPVIDLYEDHLFFTSRRPKAGERLFNQDEDIFLSEDKSLDWSPCWRLDKNVNTEANEAVIGLSADGKTMFLFRSFSAYFGNVMITHGDKSLKVWSDPKNFGPEINTKVRETHACLTPDGNTLYFVSNRTGEGSIGGRDIYIMHLMPDNTWSKPKCLPDNINTIYDEETPFIHPDGETMFFSSSGHNTMGGYDVYYTKIRDDNKYDDPVNLGYPINSTGDDVSYVLNMDGRRGYLASTKPDGYGDYDIYEIVQDGVYINEMVVFSGSVSDINNNTPADMKIRVISKDDETVHSICRPSSIDGKYFLILKPDEDYIIEYDAAGHILASAEVTPEKDQLRSFEKNYMPIKLDPVALVAYKYVETVYFEAESEDFTASSNANLDRVISKYETSDDMIININLMAGRETELLTKQRADNIVDYLVTNGVNERIIYFEGDFPAGYTDIFAIEMVDEQSLADISNDPIDPTNVGTADTIYIDHVFFAFDLYNVRSQFYENLNELAEYMISHPGTVVEVAGHTDWYGTNEYNYLLSYNRSKAVKDYLVAKGVNPENLISQKFGEGTPIADNAYADGSDNSVGRQYNRRVQFRLIESGLGTVMIFNDIVIEDGNAKNVGTLQGNDSDGSTTDGTASAVDASKYTVQVFALRNEKSIDFFADLVGVTLHRSKDGWFRYYVGEFNTKSEAKDAAKRLRDMGYDPFVRKLSFYK